MNRFLIKGLIALLVGVPLFDAAAFSESDFLKLSETKACKGCDLSEVRFRPETKVWVYGKFVVGTGDEAHISGTGVRARSLPSTGDGSSIVGKFEDGEVVSVLTVRGNWKWVLRNGVNLVGVNLRWANLSGSDLSGVSLDNANLGGANLTKVNLRMAKLSGASMVGTNLTGADLEEANLSGTNLRWANLSSVNLRWAQLRGANLEDAIFCHTIMPNNKENNSGC